MYVRQTPKGTFRFAECYKDPLTGKRREVSVTLAKNTAAARKEAAICLQKKIAAMSAPDSRSIRLGDLIDKFVAYQYSTMKGDYYPFMNYYENGVSGAKSVEDNHCDAVSVSNNRHQILCTLSYKF